ncbi:hypothetical protein SADUNF_Sadunf04G0117700 [Salix dunnii]|uniref:Uncharacterized protein n=1 Tax=Salix dunnii TaxID=1413687 RepID=A0A835KBP5_9ROSI|nr:hypothetical protein SADUNF_Sadunf04G0117700 [Salix dunnii]
MRMNRIIEAASGSVEKPLTVKRPVCYPHASISVILMAYTAFSYITEWNKHNPDCPELSSCIISSSALIKALLQQKQKIINYMTDLIHSHSSEAIVTNQIM